MSDYTGFVLTYVLPFLGVVALALSVKAEKTSLLVSSGLLLIGFVLISFLVLPPVGAVLGAVVYIPVWAILTIARAWSRR